MPGWFVFPSHLWPSIAATFDGEWETEAALADLHWWADQVKMGKRAKLPGRTTLGSRWRWGDKRTRLFLSKHGNIEALLSGLSVGPAKGQVRVQPRATTPGPKGPSPASQVPVITNTEVQEGGTPGSSQGPGEGPAKGQPHARVISARAHPHPAPTPTITTTPQPPIDDLQSQAVTPAQRRLLGILKHWTTPSSNAPQRWVVDWPNVLGWWAQSILANEKYTGLDFDQQLERWGDHLETVVGLAASRKLGTKKAKFPTVWKSAIRTWFNNAVSYAQQDTGPNHDRPTTGRRSTRRRRGQAQGSTAGLFGDIKPWDAGADG